MGSLLVLALALPLLAGAAAPAISAEPKQLVLGRDVRVTLRVRTDGGSARLRAFATVGELSSKDVQSGDEARYEWTPPTTRFPQVAMLLFWTDEDSGAPEVAIARIPLIGRTDLEVNTEPGAQVRVEVAQQVFGPRRADGRGRVRVPIDVPPGVRTAKVLGEGKGKSSVLTVPLEVPSANPLAAVIVPDPIRHRRSAWLWVFHAEKLDVAQVELAVQGAKAKAPQHEEDRAIYELVPDEGASRVSASVGLRGKPEARVRTAARVLAPDEPPPAPPASPTAPAVARTPFERFVPSLSIGGFYAGGGGNSGARVAAVIGYRLPALDDRLAAELEVGWRQANANVRIAGLGTMESTVVALPIALALRGRLIQSGGWSLDARVGVGALPFEHRTRSDFQASFSEPALGGEFFAGLQTAWRVGAFELFLEMRGGYAPARTPHLTAELGGVSLAIGGRFSAR